MLSILVTDVSKQSSISKKCSSNLFAAEEGWALEVVGGQRSEMLR
jgi:hypothetical protein